MPGRGRRGRKHRSCPAACLFRGACWPEGAGVPCLTAVRDAPAWRCSGREGGCRAGLSARFAQALHQARRCFGVLRFSPRGERSRMSGIGLRPQKSPPCGGLRHSRWRPGFRDCPREGARSCLQLGMHAVLSEEGGSEGRKEGASRLMREKPLPSMLVSSVAGLRPGPKRQPFLLPCGRRCGGRRR